jgi:hypothetical protein
MLKGQVFWDEGSKNLFLKKLDKKLTHLEPFLGLKSTLYETR